VKGGKSNTDPQYNGEDSSIWQGRLWSTRIRHGIMLKSITGMKNPPLRLDMLALQLVNALTKFHAAAFQRVQILEQEVSERLCSTSRYGGGGGSSHFKNRNPKELEWSDGSSFLG
jgi:hypothetical protein